VYEGDDTTSGDWRHVDLDTFIRFCEFAYRGDTTSPVQWQDEDSITGNDVVSQSDRSDIVNLAIRTAGRYAFIAHAATVHTSGASSVSRAIKPEYEVSLSADGV
jgi:diadenosine tetraphosphatase ApaH/serine/threonine PP2A family protein phosphatase